MHLSHLGDQKKVTRACYRTDLSALVGLIRVKMQGFFYIAMQAIPELKMSYIPKFLSNSNLYLNWNSYLQMDYLLLKMVDNILL